jgi:hypothetical protein
MKDRFMSSSFCPDVDSTVLTIVLLADSNKNNITSDISWIHGLFLSGNANKAAQVDS